MDKIFKIISAKYKTSAVRREQFLTDLPEFAFVGRSNVGKSSFINSLTGIKKLAKTSSTPGHTKMVNYFLINNCLYFVDLPGYGFSKTGKSHRQLWSQLIEDYLNLSKQLKLVFLLLDIRHNPTELDLSMLKFLYLKNIPFKIIATKSDKVAKSKIKQYCLELANKLSVGLENVIPYSIQQSTGLQNFSTSKQVQTTYKSTNEQNKPLNRATKITEIIHKTSGKEKVFEIIDAFIT